MRAIDWAVMAAFLGFIVIYGVWRGRGQHTLNAYLLADRSMPWFVVALSVMATQASAITFLSTPGQGYADGMRFVQFYFGLPLAMIVLCATAVPIFHRLKVFTAYEYLERRFDGKTRALAALLFLTQRGLACGLTIFAPSLIFSVLLGVPVHLVCLALGGAVVVYTATGGARAVAHTHTLQFLVILGTMALAFGLVVSSLPRDVSLIDAGHLAGTLGRLNAIDTSLDPTNRYTLWSGLIGGFFLQMSYFGADQSQVGRYLAGKSVAQSRIGLLINGMLKVPMQFLILLLGVMVFAHDLFVTPPAFFNPVEADRLRASVHAPEFAALESDHRQAAHDRAAAARRLVEARHAGDRAAVTAAEGALGDAQQRFVAVRGEVAELVRTHDPKANPSDTNYIFLSYVLHHLPVGIIGLVLAAIFAASMNSVASELHALTSTTIIDVHRRWFGGGGDERSEVRLSRVVTLAWGGFAILFAETASRLGSLVEAVNILGSLFYGTILGLFLSAFYLRRVGGTAVFVAALIAEALVVACFTFTRISFLWYNAIGCLGVIVLALALSRRWPRAAGHAGA